MARQFRSVVGQLLLICVLAWPGGVLAQEPRKEVAQELRKIIESGEVVADIRDDEDLIQVFIYYQDRNYTPLWVRDAGPKFKAQEFVRALKAAGEHGLEPADYRMAEIDKRMASRDFRQLAELEIVLTRSFLDYAHDMTGGRVDPKAIDSELNLKPRRGGTLRLIDGVEAADDISAEVLAKLAPRTPAYQRLKEKLAEYRALAKAGGWPKVAAGAALKPGMNEARVPQVREVLLQMGDLAQERAQPGNLFDKDLAEAVKFFQSRHGLEQDGVVAGATLAAMNTPVETRIAAMVLNLERRRWMEDELGQTYVFVNLADQHLKVVENEKSVHDTRLVVGKPYQRTPVFTELMTYVVFNPYWSVPPSIAVNEYLPKLKRDPGVLARENIRVLGPGGSEVSPFSVDWNGLTTVPYTLRQDPGQGNALGRVKFMFPNPHNVYLHDTPAKGLFARASRLFSHGCMRVQNPEALAEVLLKAEGWDRARIAKAIASNEQVIVNLKRKIPVYVNYLTAWVNKDGTANFRADVYGRDQRLAAALGRAKAATQ
jgi:murein L,D-transpeptidase YcbB/YkuD